MKYVNAILYVESSNIRTHFYYNVFLILINNIPPPLQFFFNKRNFQLWDCRVLPQALSAVNLGITFCRRSRWSFLLVLYDEAIVITSYRKTSGMQLLNTGELPPNTNNGNQLPVCFTMLLSPSWGIGRPVWNRIVTTCLTSGKSSV